MLDIIALSFVLALIVTIGIAYASRVKPSLCYMGKHSFRKDKYRCLVCNEPRGHLKVIQGGKKTVNSKF